MSQTQPPQTEVQTGAGSSQMPAENDKEKHRGLTKQYRHALYQMKSRGDDMIDVEKPDFGDMLGKVNTLSKQVSRPSEQADDAEVFCELAGKGAEMSKRVAAGKGRTINDFLRHLKATYVTGDNAQEDGEANPHAFNWGKLGKHTSLYFYSVPGVSCLLGPLDQIPKPKRQIQRQARKPVGRAVAPTELTAEDPEAQEKRETERNMETMHAILRGKPEGVGYLELTMNMQSFAQFAENCFTLSFLIVNKLARLAKSDPQNSKGLMVYYNEKHNSNDAAAEGAKERSQLVLVYSMQDWDEWRKYVQPKDCLMPHRAEHEGEVDAQQNQTQADIETHETHDSQQLEVSSGLESEGTPPVETHASRKRKSVLLGTNDKGTGKKSQHRLSRGSK